jgi:hypothetical protein
MQRSDWSISNRHFSKTLFTENFPKILFQNLLFKTFFGTPFQDTNFLNFLNTPKKGNMMSKNTWFSTVFFTKKVAIKIVLAHDHNFHNNVTVFLMQKLWSFASIIFS